MKPKATRSSRIVSYRTKTNLAIERCEPRLALDASQVPESQPIDEGFLEVIQPAPTFTLNSNVGGRLSERDDFVIGGLINYGDILSDSGSVNAFVALPPSMRLSYHTLSYTGTDVDHSAWDQVVVQLVPSRGLTSASSGRFEIDSTNASLDVGGYVNCAAPLLGMTDEFALKISHFSGVEVYQMPQVKVVKWPGAGLTDFALVV